MRTRAQAGPMVVDTASIAATFAFDEPKLQSLLDAPTIELVKDLLTSLTSKASEVDEAKSEKLRADVELENTIRSNESRVKSLKTTVNKGLKDVEDIRRKLNEQGGLLQLLILRGRLTDCVARKCEYRTSIRD